MTDYPRFQPAKGGSDEAYRHRTGAGLVIAVLLLSRWRLAARATVLGFLLPNFVVLLAAAAPASAWKAGDWTVVTLAREGSWGVATASSQGQGIGAAIRDCKAMAAAPTDCGAQFVTTRGRWIIATLCGDQKIIAIGQDREDATRAALYREIDLKRLYVPDMPRCERVLTVDPCGAVFPTKLTGSACIVAARQLPPSKVCHGDDE